MMEAKTDRELLMQLTTQLDQLVHDLMGNGQPGKIDHMERRISKLENWKWWVVGIAIGLGAAGGGLITHSIEGLLK